MACGVLSHVPSCKATLSFYHEALPSPLPHGGVIFLLLLGGLPCHLPVSTSETGVFCRDALIALRQLLAVILHPEMALPSQVGIGLLQLAVLLGLRLRGGALLVVVGRDGLMVCRGLGPSNRLLEIKLLCRLRTHM